MSYPIDECRSDDHLFSEAIDPEGGYTTESVTHGENSTRPTVTCPAKEHCHLASTLSYCIEGRRLSWLRWLFTKMLYP